MTLNKIIRIFELAIIGVTVFVLSFLAAFFYLKVGDLRKITFSSLKNSIPKLFVVESGSMEPAIKTGSIVITEPSYIYAQNDVISFKSGKKVITHRIMYRSFPDGVNAPATYQTSGDANEDFDPFVVKQEQIVGKVVYDIPYVGYVANFAKQPYGFILLVIVPATIVIYEELKSLLGQIYSSLLEHTKKKKKKEGVMPVRKKKIKGMFLLSRTSVLIPVFGAVFVFTGLAASYFSDKETSAGNVMQAGEWGPKIAQTLVINEVVYDTNCTNPENKQWIELWNGSGSTVDLKDWSLQDHLGNTIQIVNSQTLLPPGKFALLSKSSATWNDQCYGPYLSDVVTAQLGGQITISPTGGAIKLLDLNLNVIDRVQYGNLASYQTGVNRSTERKILGLDTALGDTFNDSDFERREPSTAGFALPENQDVVINEFVVRDNSGGQGKDWVEIYNKSGASVDISNWTLRDTTGVFYTFPAATNIAVNGFNAIPDMSNRLDNGGDRIYLFDSGGNLVDGISYYLFLPTQPNSVGRQPDGGSTWKQYSGTDITKGLSNPGSGGVNWP